MNLKFYKCNVCGQIVGIVKQSKYPLSCCNQNMEKIYPNIEEAPGNEKHLPVVKIKRNKVEVRVGKTLHPSLDDHYIEWIALETNRGNQRKMLKPGELPIVTFAITKDEKVQAVYAYCNVHSLWKTDVLFEEFERECGCVLDK